MTTFWTIVLNWNQKELTAACLNSLARSDCVGFKVVVVDNGSTDGSVEYLSNGFPWVHLLTNKENLGFTGGNNVGIRYALSQGADLIWLLNNDTEVAPDCITELLRGAAAHPEYALFGPKIYCYYQPQTLWYAGGILALHRSMAGVSIGSLKPDDGRFDQEVEISFVTGCAFLIRTEAVQRIGLLDEDLFAYCEDTEWCIRAQRARLRALYLPKARLWHKIGSTALEVAPEGRWGQAYLKARNRFVIQRRYSSALGVMQLIPRFLARKASRRAYRALLRGDPRETIALLQGVWDGIRGAPRRYP